MPSVFLSRAEAVVARTEASFSRAAESASEEDFREEARVRRELVRASWVEVSASRRAAEFVGEVGERGLDGVPETVWAVVVEVGERILVRERRVEVVVAGEGMPLWWFREGELRGSMGLEGAAGEVVSA